MSPYFKIDSNIESIIFNLKDTAENCNLGNVSFWWNDRAFTRQEFSLNQFNSYWELVVSMESNSECIRDIYRLNDGKLEFKETERD